MVTGSGFGGSSLPQNFGSGQNKPDAPIEQELMSIGQKPHKRRRNPDSHPQFHNLETWSKNSTRSQGW
jgi:hypothetical protein